MDIQETFNIETEQEADGRWIAEIADLPGVLAYGETVEKARANAEVLALRVIADRLEQDEQSGFSKVSFAFA